MKKLAILLAVFMINTTFLSSKLKAQTPEDPELGGGNSWGGVCCMYIPQSCYHPIGLNIPESYWRTIYPTCP
jgi:hypothetical protein